MLATVSTISLSLFLLWNSGEKSSNPKTKKSNPEQVISQNIPVKPEPVEAKNNQQKPLPGKQISFLSGMPDLIIDLPVTPENERTETSGETPRDHKPASPKYPDETPYQFPKLTEEEIAITKKKKKTMLKALIKYDKNSYAFIPSGAFDYNGQQISAQAFYIGTGEVTNFEYRTFLFDLLIQDRKEEFLKAKPDQSMWTKAFNHEGKPSENAGKGFQEHYFSHKGFNEYPVVNISREGAELYCKWLSDEAQKSIGDEKGSKFNGVRLPLRAEWVKAASNDGKMQPYPWGGPYTRDRRGLIQANYLRSREEILEEAGSKTYNLDVTAPSKSFWPNERGMYNLSGNVAEMVYEGMEKNEPGTAGGSWKSTAEEIKIYAPDPYKGITDPKPTIGFRVVSTYLILNKK